MFKQTCLQCKKQKKKGVPSKQQNVAKNVRVEEQQHEVQMRILEQLQKVNKRVDVMEDKVEEVAQRKGKDKIKLSKKFQVKKC